MDTSSITPTPHQLKALTHPTRLRMLGMLRIDGPATATTLAARLGINTGAASYHLRQLAQHGWVVDDESQGNARDRWWKAAHRATVTDRDSAKDQDARETAEAYIQSVVVVMTELMQRAVEELPLVPKEWSDASTFSDWVIKLTPARAKALVEALATTLSEVEEEGEEGAEDFVVQLSSFPYPGRVGGAS
ncbi:MAG TPA: helix-turn-helix domain-containing protein [Nocardioides sp.]|uniref:helix-turn-helix domain-containing protein n=1 Tax=Nocardioides sp. TaxID=35761 RepID=UPI002E3338F0|nr:helix-turn-helix domain-containing protein [Nocardioides sp.]HEX5086670.1 helix-turn-helix domain-containing protein [Nocardioides sp.]